MKWRYRNTVLVIAVLANLCQMSSRLVVSPLVPDILETFSTSKTAVGLAFTGMWMAYALAQFPSGLLGARFGERRVILASFTLVTVGSLSLSAASSFPLFAFSVFFLGGGAGLYFPVAASLLSKLFEKRGQALGFMTAAGSFGGLVAPIIGAYVGTRYGWRTAALLGASIAVPLLVSVVVRVRPTEPDRPSQPLRSRIDPVVILDLLTTPRIVYSIFLAAAGTFTFQAVTTFFPTFLVEQYSFSTEYAGVLFGVIFLLSTFSQPLTGRLSDEVGRDVVISGTMLVAISGFFMVLNGAQEYGAIVAVALLGTGMSWFPVVVSRIMAVLPEDDQGRGFGLARTAYMLLGALGSVVTGAVADSQGWVMAYGVVAGLLVVSVGLVVLNRASGSRL